MLYNNIPQPIHFYDSPYKSNWNKRRCVGVPNEVIFHRHNYLPRFLIVRDSSAYNSWVLRFYTPDGTLVYTITGPSITIVTIGSLDYIATNEAGLVSALDDGTYYMTLTDGNDTYYSDQFNVAECIDRMVGFEWGDECSVLGVPYGELTYLSKRFTFSFWAKTELGEPKFETTQQVNDTGTQEVVESTVTKRLTKLHDFVPEYIVECFHAMKHHQTVEMTWPAEVPTTFTGTVPSEEYDILVDSVEANPAGSGCLYDCLAYIKYQDRLSSACCDEDLAVTEECYESVTTITYGAKESQQTYVEGVASVSQTVAVTERDLQDASNQFCNNSGRIGTWIGSSWIWSSPLSGRIYTVATEDVNDPPEYSNFPILAVSDGGTPTGLDWIPANPTPICMVAGTDVDLSIDGTASGILTGRFAKVLVSDDDFSTSTVVWAGLESDLVSGISFDKGSNTKVRIQYYTHQCSYGYSKKVSIEAEGEGVPG